MEIIPFFSEHFQYFIDFIVYNLFKCRQSLKSGQWTCIFTTYASLETGTFVSPQSLGASHIHGFTKYTDNNPGITSASPFNSWEGNSTTSWKFSFIYSERYSHELFIFLKFNFPHLKLFIFYCWQSNYSSSRLQTQTKNGTELISAYKKLLITSSHSKPTGSFSLLLLQTQT